MTATPDAGSYFNGWGGGLAGSNSPETLTFTGNENVTAVFERNFVNFTTPSQQAGEGFNIIFTAQSDVNVSAPVTVRWTITNGTTVDADFPGSVTTGTGIINTGNNSVNFLIGTFEDTVYELDETFTLTLSIDSGPAFAGATNTAAGKIVNDDTYDVSIGATAYNPTETDSDFTLNIPVNLDQTVPGGTTVSYSVTPASATALNDYVDVTAGTLTYTAVQTTQNIQLTIKGDDLLEQHETFSVSLTAGANQTVSNTPATVTITDDETATATLAAGIAGAEPATAATYTVSLDKQNDTGSPITVTYAFTDGTATGGGTDYTSSTTTVDVLAGQSNATITVPVDDDAFLEATETFNVTLAAATSNARVTGDTTAVTNSITSEDTATATLAAGIAGAEPATAATYTVSLDRQNDTGSAITVTYAFTDGTATGGGTDYTSSTTTVDVLAGQSNATITVPVNDDALLEATETFNVTLAAATSNAQVAGDTTAITNSITSDDTATVSVAKTTDAAEPGTAATFTVTMTSTNNTGSAITIPYSFTNGTATGGSDFDNSGVNITIADAANTAVINVPVTDDALLEATETFSLTIADSSDNAQVTAVGTVTDIASITSDDTAIVNLTANTPGAENGAGATTAATFTVTMDKTNDTGSNITVNYSLSDGSAAGGSDFDNSGSSVVIGTGLNNATISVPVFEDVIVENAETFTATVTGTDNGQVTAAVDGSQTRSSSITDDDNTTVSISATIAAASEPGTNGEFTVQLTGGKTAPPGGITVNYAIDGATTATAGSDYNALPGTFSIPVGTSSVAIPVNVIDNTVVEGDETLIVNLVSTDHGSVAIAASPNDSAAVTISDDDAASFTITDVTPPADELERDAALWVHAFDITLDNDVDQSVTIDFTTADGSATLADADYVLNANTLLFSGTAGQTLTISVFSIGDTKVEADETFAVNLSNVVAGGKNVTIATAQAIGTIVNDDAATLTITDVSQDEDNGAMTFTVTLSETIQGGVSVDFATADGSAEDMGGDGDYTGIPTGTLNFTGTANEQLDINVSISSDTKVEADETFSVTLSNIVHTAAGGTVTLVGSPATGTITNDDTATLTIASVGNNEGDVPADNVDLTFTVTLSADVQGGVSVDYATGNSTATTGDGDFTGVAGTLNFTGNASEAIGILVPIGEDGKIEADETFTVTLSNIVHSAEPGQFTAVDSPAIGTIINDDTSTLLISDVSQAEGSGGGFTPFNFTVTSPVEVQGGFDLAFTVNDGTATDADDYDVITTSPITFAGTAGETQTIRVDVVADDVSEDDESFTVTLGALSNINPTAADDITTGAVGTGSIIYDDYEAFMGADITVAEGDVLADSVNLTFTVNLDRPNKSGSNINLRVTTSDDTATAGSDYNALTNFTVAVPDTELSETFNVAVIEDEIVENDEVFFVDLTTASANTIVQAFPNDRAVGTITNDDQATLAIDDVVANEGADATTTTFTFTVTLTGAVDQAFTVDWATSDDTAVADTDYLAAFGTLNFAGTDGETQTIDVTVNGDDEVEYDETFFVNLISIAAGGKNVIFSDAIGEGGILNDNKYRATINDVSVDEQDGVAATIPATFTITLHQAVLAGQTVTIGYETSGTATEAGHTESPIAVAGTDYTAIAASTVDFTGGEVSESINVTVLNEALDVDLEYYYLNISAVSANAQIDDSTGVGTIVDNEYEVVASVDATNNQGGICRGATCADPDDIPPDALTISEIIERSSDSSGYTVTADAGYCIGDVTRDGTSVLGGAVPISPYSYTATNIQNDPTNIVASFRSEINFTTNIAPVDAQTYGRWRLRDTAKATYRISMSCRPVIQMWTQPFPQRWATRPHPLRMMPG